MWSHWNHWIWNKKKTLAACMFALAWWGIFYPELCFNEGTCEAVCMEEEDAKARGTDMAAGEIDAGEVWQASGDRLVIGSRFLEWCEERLKAGKE